MSDEREMARAIDEIAEAAEAHQCTNQCKVCLDLLCSTLNLLRRLEFRLRQIHKVVNGGDRTGND